MAAAPAPYRSYTSGRFALRLDTGNVADFTLVKGVDGGSIFADVEQSGGPPHYPKKHLGQTKYEDFSVRLGFGSSNMLLDWIAQSWGPQPEKKTGAVVALNFDYKVKRTHGFLGALVTKTTFPALDAATKEFGFLTVQVTPEMIQESAGSGSLPLVSVQQKLWLAGNFRLEIEDLDCTKVSRIDSFAVTRDVRVHTSGSGEVTLLPGRVEFPNLRITLSEAFAASWFHWHRDFVVNGDNDESAERNGTLRFLSPNLQAELSRIDLHHLGIVRMSRPSEAEGIARVRAELYCEEMVFSHGGGN